MTIGSIIKFSRPKIVATCGAIVLLGSAASGSVNYKSLLGILIIFCLAVHANTINDYTDLEIDKINLKHSKDRPLVSKEVTLKYFWLIHFTSMFLALAISLAFSLKGLILTSIVLSIDYMYSLKPFRLTDKTLISPIILALTYTICSFTFGWWSVESSKPYPFILTAGLVFGFLARLLLKDFRDSKGDKKHGKITFLIKYGSKKTILASAVLWITSMSLVVLYSNFSVGVMTTLLIATLIVCIWLTRLGKIKELNNQEAIIKKIALIANYSIIIIFTYILTNSNLSTYNEKQAIILIIGTMLILSALIGIEKIKVNK